MDYRASPEAGSALPVGRARHLAAAEVARPRAGTESHRHRHFAVRQQDRLIDTSPMYATRAACSRRAGRPAATRLCATDLYPVEQKARRTGPRGGTVLAAGAYLQCRSQPRVLAPHDHAPPPATAGRAAGSELPTTPRRPSVTGRALRAPDRLRAGAVQPAQLESSAIILPWPATSALACC